MHKQGLFAVRDELFDFAASGAIRLMILPTQH